LSNISYDGNEAVTSQSRSELLKRHISTAGEEHLATFRADADGLLTRTQWAFDRLQHLEQIAASLPPADRPTPFQHGPRTLPDEPVAWGDDGTGQPDPAGNHPEDGPTTGPPEGHFENTLKDNLQAELDAADDLGVRPISPADPGFDQLVNDGPVKWAVLPDGTLLVQPHDVYQQEISHAVLSRGGPVLAAGTADIVGDA
ncbi:hypothetical protein, partial [Micromonospora sonneratiae]